MQPPAGPRRPIQLAADGWSVEIVDQTQLPHRFEIRRLETLSDAARAIVDMEVRGAPLIGVTAAYGLCLALRSNSADAAFDDACRTLAETRPTAVNLRWAIEEIRSAVAGLEGSARIEAAYRRASAIAEEDVAACSAIGDHGVLILEALWAKKGRSGVLNILTHCNAGRLATVEWGTATAPVYKAHASGLPVHVYVDETRPRNQGAALTAYELGEKGVPHTLIVDNAGGHLMQHGLVDVCIVGADRVTADGDAANKIGTYLKALAAKDNGIPFYVAAPSSTIDWTIGDGVASIPIEERAPEEVARVRGRDEEGRIVSVAIAPDTSAAANYAFDVTPARLISGLITERGVAEASRDGLARLYNRAST